MVIREAQTLNFKLLILQSMHGVYRAPSARSVMETTNRGLDVSFPRVSAMFCHPEKWKRPWKIAGSRFACIAEALQFLLPLGHSTTSVC